MEKEEVLVIYPLNPERPPSWVGNDEIRFLFLPDDKPLRETLRGYSFSGLIIEEGADITGGDLVYFIGRLRTSSPVIMLMSEYHKSLLKEVLDRKWRDGYTEDTRKRIIGSVIPYPK